MKKIKIYLKKNIKNFFRKIFKSELEELKRQNSKTDILNTRLTNIIGEFEVSVDVHYRSKSWAVISLQGDRSDFIKFVDLGHRDINEISHFLRRFDRAKVDAAPQETAFLKFKRNRF